MSIDVTEQQSDDDRQRSRELSLKSTHPPTQTPGYEAQRLLGTGAYGEVWVGRDLNTGRQVAIKFYAHRRSVDWSLLSREVEKLVFLSADRYVVQLLDVGWDSDPPYYVMEYIENGSLDDLLKNRGTLSVPDAVELWKEITTGLAHAHGKGVLHCDLKPANILLDADTRPRLADFGQSRLSHEQRPALGTLFYMAPEQADLQAVPDVRWDVYALGAILYCLLVGLPPHRNEDSISHIDTAGDLADRLARYRKLITTSPLPSEHRRVAGIDRALADIIDRCLAPHPSDRFANVQEVLDAIHAREQARARRPLLVMGFVGPLILLTAMAFFGFRGYEQALTETANVARDRALENNDFAARLAAEKVTVKIANFFSIVQSEAVRSDLAAHLKPVMELPSLKTLDNPQSTNDQMVTARDSFVRDPLRKKLEDYLNERLDEYQRAAKQDPRLPKFASMFVTDRYGTQLAVVFDDDRKGSNVGRNVSHRNYFSGVVEAPESPRASLNARHIESTHLSNVFQSSSTGRWRVAISTPLRDENGEFNGVLVLTVNVADLELVGSTSSTDSFAVLIDGRQGETGGTILHHPLYEEVSETMERLPKEFFEKRVPPEIIAGQAKPQGSGGNYVDPLGEHPLGKEKYQRPWLAVAAPVKLPDASQKETGLMVLMQEDYRRVISPVEQLGRRLLQEGLTALAVVVLLSVGLWWFVGRLFREPRPTIRVSVSGSATQATPLHDVPTLAQTIRNRRKVE
jgi:hypothetical protein